GATGAATAAAGAGAPATEATINLPTPPTPFIGRAAQVVEIQALLLRPEVRLVTLTGPGGTGKTRLSLEVAHAVLPQFAAGAAFVSLADDRDREQLVARLALALDVRAAGTRPLWENVAEFLRDRQMLLVLDNFEQLVASAAPAVADLLAAAPRVKVLI